MQNSLKKIKSISASKLLITIVNIIWYDYRDWDKKNNLEYKVRKSYIEEEIIIWHNRYKDIIFTEWFFEDLANYCLIKRKTVQWLTKSILHYKRYLKSHIDLNDPLDWIKSFIQ